MYKLRLSHWNYHFVLFRLVNMVSGKLLGLGLALELGLGAIFLGGIFPRTSK